METITRAPLGGINRQAPQAPVKVRYCLYARKSTEEEDRQALSIESQVKEMEALAEKEGLEVVEIKRESHSSKEVGQRAVYNELLAEIRTGKFNGIITWAPDRLSRNAGDLGALVDLMDKGALIEIRTYTQKFTNNPGEKFMLMILGSQAKLENDQKTINVKRGLRARCEMGWRPGVAPTGYLNEKHVDKKCQVRLDPKRSIVVRQMFEKMGNDGWSGRQTYRWLNQIKFETRNGRKLSLSNLYLILRSPFYYGEFEYPAGGGMWYQGKQPPIISKELFDKVQVALQRSLITPDETREFAFTRLMKCGLCGGGITAYEKAKKLKDGSVNKYNYYICTKKKQVDCKNPPINETGLIEELSKMLDTVSLDEIGMRTKIEEELKRHNKFRMGVLGATQKEKDVEIDIRNYAKYLLKEGAPSEKREVVSYFKNTLLLKDKKISLK